MNNPIQIEKIDYQGWPNSYRVSNGAVDLVITGDIGPRIMRYGFAGGQNLFKEVPEELGRSGEPTWQLRGGHRIWVAPEDPYLTYAPDNGPVEVAGNGDVIEATQPVEPTTGLVKQLVGDGRLERILTAILAQQTDPYSASEALVLETLGPQDK